MERTMGTPRKNAAYTRIDESGGMPSPDEVNYREAEDPAQACSECLNFDGRDGCAKVAGPVEAAGTCDLFEPAAMPTSIEETPTP